MAVFIRKVIPDLIFGKKPNQLLKKRKRRKLNPKTSSEHIIPVKINVIFSRFFFYKRFINNRPSGLK